MIATFKATPVRYVFVTKLFPAAQITNRPPCCYQFEVHADLMYMWTKDQDSPTKANPAIIIPPARYCIPLLTPFLTLSYSVCTTHFLEQVISIQQNTTAVKLPANKLTEDDE